MVSVKHDDRPAGTRSDGVSKLEVTKTAFTIAHLSDLHLFSLDGVAPLELLNKRVYGYLRWFLHRGVEHRDEVLSAMLRDLQHTRPDHIVVTGDLTHLGLPDEFRKAEQLLQSLGPPSQVTVIPGNHDTYVRSPWERTFASWEDYMVSDTIELNASTGANPQNMFPSVRIRGKTVFIGISTARPSAPFLATGTVGPEQLHKLEVILAETGQQELFRVLLIHHPPVSGIVSWRKRLKDGPALRSILVRRGVELVLHGHAHRRSLSQLETCVGNVPIVGVPSASSIGRKPYRRARYHIYRLSPNAGGWDLRLSVRGYSPVKDHFLAEGEPHMILSRPTG